MNRIAYYMSGYTLKAFSGFSKAQIHIHGRENVPDASVIFTANHFTRIETIFLPYHIHGISKKPVWSLADSELFEGALKGVLPSIGAVSTKDPSRDLVIVKNLISGNAHWIIFPEGMMVKNKKLVQHNEFKLFDGEAVYRPHTGAATIALRTEFYRERLRRMKTMNPDEFNRLVELFEISDPGRVLDISTVIVPVNITYYPVRARRNVLSSIVLNFMDEPSQRMLDELMTEGTMVLSGVDVDIRFGDPIRIEDYFHNSFIESDLTSRRPIDFSRHISSRPVMRASSVGIMQRYMASVYGMTTLNYDHIFASILKYMPGTYIDIHDFRCRAFLAITDGMMEPDRNFHRSLHLNQIHLLTDDRHNRFGDFLQTALDTGSVSLDHGMLFKHRERFNSDSNFHTIRIDNPVSVMANEVEPMARIQAFLKEIARKDPKEISMLVKNRLLEKAEQEFETDYDTYYLEGESKPREAGSPILLCSTTGSTTGVLLIHGYMAAPSEMKEFAEFLNSRGYTVYVPRLKGHGTSPEDLARTGYGQWIESAEEGYVILSHMCDRIFVGGFSTGAGLALDLTTRVDGIEGMFAVAPPMKLMDFGSYLIPAMTIWNQMMKKARLGSIAKEFFRNDPENPRINYLRNPVAGVRQLERFMNYLEPRLSTIDVPVLVVQSRNDPVVNPEGTQKLFRKLGAELKEFYLFDFDRHGILLGEGAGRVHRAIADFLESLE
ncbi:MAG: alpha/beta fold hydrolase [Desulfobacteraceae bacterium]|nr:alpha/beta fold hydrolase [Desulfobacteraceae bacterium]